MVKSINKIAFRKLYKNKFLLLGLALLIIIGVGFFVTLFTIATRYEETTEQYFIDYAYADCTFYGNFDGDNLNFVKRQSGITFAEGRYVKDYKKDDITLRTISLCENINKPYFYSGTMPSGNGECLILKQNADAMNIKAENFITIGSQNLKVTGIIASTEYIYLVKNERSFMSDPNNFCVVYVNQDFFSGNFNEIVVKGAEFDNKEIAKSIDAQKSLLQNRQMNYNGYKDDLNQIKSFAFIFPGIFAVLILIVVYVVLKRTAVKDRKQIAVYKALGIKNKEIIKIYLTQFIITFFIAAIIGCLVTTFVVGIIINIFSSMFQMPFLNYHLYPWLWIGSVIVSLILCVIPGILSLRDILKIEPVQAMRETTRKGGKKMFMEKIPFLWNKLSFNSKVTFKSMFRSKARFFAVLLGLTGTCALLTLSFGFNDSIKNTRSAYFDKFAKYDLIVNSPLDDASINYLKDGAEYAKVLQIPISINDTDSVVNVVKNDFDFLDLDADKLKSGIIIPEYYAKKWKVKEGDKIVIEGYSYTVSEIITQTMALCVYTDYDYIKSVNPDFPDIYNTVYVRGQNLENLITYLNANDIVYSTIEDDTATFKAVSQTVSLLIFIMIICALILGITVLYTVGLMNLSARENEYMLMNTLGYSRKKLMLIYLKESIIQIILALPLGFLSGILLLYAIQGKFSNSSFVVKATVYPLSYLLSLAIILSISAVMYFVTNRQIKNLNITEGLKAQDD